MRYVFEEPELTCVELEEQLGLERGDIKEITIYPEGGVEVESVELNATKLRKLRSILRAHNLPRGKKREEG